MKVSEKELFLGSLARGWELLTQTELVSILVAQQDGGPPLLEALEASKRIPAEKLTQLTALAEHAFRDRSKDVTLKCIVCGFNTVVPTYDPREAYKCGECGKPQMPEEGGNPRSSLPTIEEIPSALSNVDADMLAIAEAPQDRRRDDTRVIRARARVEDAKQLAMQMRTTEQVRLLESAPEVPTGKTPEPASNERQAACSCGKPIEADWRYCPRCAAPVQPCSECGRGLEAAWKICPYCATVS